MQVLQHVISIIWLAVFTTLALAGTIGFSLADRRGQEAGRQRYREQRLIYGVFLIVFAGFALVFLWTYSKPQKGEIGKQ
jgi:hypothetical protein